MACHISLSKWAQVPLIAALHADESVTLFPRLGGRGRHDTLFQDKKLKALVQFNLFPLPADAGMVRGLDRLNMRVPSTELFTPTTVFKRNV